MIDDLMLKIDLDVITLLLSIPNLFLKTALRVKIQITSTIIIFIEMGKIITCSRAITSSP